MGGFALVLTIGVGSTYAKDQIQRNNVISLTAAKNFAFVDAGITEEEVTNLEIDLEKEFGVYFYDVDFLINGKSYSYHIDATNGKVIAKEIPLFGKAETKNPANGNEASPKETDETKESTLTTQKSKNDPTQSAKNTEKITSSQKGAIKERRKPDNPLSPYLSLDRIKEITLKDSGVNKNEAIFETTKLDREYGRDVYEVEFFTEDTEYEYELDAHTGEILRHSKEPQNKISPTIIKEKQELIEKLDRLDDDDYEDNYDEFDDDRDFDDDREDDDDND